MRVLIVDDCSTMRTVLACVFTALGFSVCEAEDGSAALELCLIVRPDAVVTDVNMPVMDGLTFLERLREHPWARDLPIVVFSADEHDETKRDRCRRAGVAAWLSKETPPLCIADTLLAAYA